MSHANNSQPKSKGGRPRKGSLQFRGRSWHAVLTVTIEGESIRKWINLETDNKAVARRKLARLLKEYFAADNIEAVCEAATVPETYAELAERVAKQRKVQGIADANAEDSRERLWILPEIGHMPVPSIRAEHVAGLYENARASGKSQSHLRHLRSILRSRFAVAMEEETIQVSPVDRVRIPKVKIDRRERAVLTDVELAIYLAWQHPLKHRRLAVLERQTMSAIARMFGGLRTGDLHTLQWSHFDTMDGQFTWGVAPRKKTARPQRITVPEALRPILRDWWERARKPSIGVVFPALRGTKAGVGTKTGVSHAAALRRDLKAAFTDYREQFAEIGTDALDQVVPAPDSLRWKELFETTEFTRPVDFHSWRRKFVQALADIGINAQQAQKLAGHADLAAHERYLRTTSKTLTIPSAALPNLQVSLIASTKPRTSETTKQLISGYATRDSNARPLAPEANALSS